jgi:hypothetical protein
MALPLVAAFVAPVCTITGRAAVNPFLGQKSGSATIAHG